MHRVHDVQKRHTNKNTKIPQKQTLSIAIYPVSNCGNVS